MLKKERGITLIALIITIIVMLILVGVTINVALNGGLFTKAREASKQMQVEADRETLLSAVVAAIGYDGKVVIADIELPTGWTGTNGTYTSPKGNTFTVDENGKIEAGESKPKEEGNDAIIQILNDYYAEKISETEAVQQLKQELAIEDEENVEIIDLLEIYGEETEDGDYLVYIYVKKADEVYIADFTNNPIAFSYADEETYKEQYKLLRNIETIREELENVFSGKTQDEMVQKYNDGTLDDYVISNSEKITAIEFRGSWTSIISINFVTLYEGSDEVTLSHDEHNYTINIRYENENYSYVDVSSRNLIYFNDI